MWIAVYALQTAVVKIRTWKTNNRVGLPLVIHPESIQYLQSHSKVTLAPLHSYRHRYLLSISSFQAVAFLHIKPQVSCVVFDLLRLFIENPDFYWFWSPGCRSGSFMSFLQLVKQKDKLVEVISFTKEAGKACLEPKKKRGGESCLPKFYKTDQCSWLYSLYWYTQTGCVSVPYEWHIKSQMGKWRTASL